jgi:hypothetical protein
VLRAMTNLARVAISTIGYIEDVVIDLPFSLFQTVSLLDFSHSSRIAERIG